MTILDTIVKAAVDELVEIAEEKIADFANKTSHKNAAHDHALGLDTDHVAVLGGEHD